MIFFKQNDDEYGCLSPNFTVQPQYLKWVGLDLEFTFLSMGSFMTMG
jgi:hypothetical protein